MNEIWQVLSFFNLPRSCRVEHDAVFGSRRRLDSAMVRARVDGGRWLRRLCHVVAACARAARTRGLTVCEPFAHQWRYPVPVTVPGLDVDDVDQGQQRRGGMG